ncbi:hypothetical protein FKN01_09275 [Streptomyces sp. 130]|uniref:hypothetical protein n=1 Tax=Streptomyces sp. 130 TaxID=2591006 RepID=UPI00117CFC1D|nr:hypothetical protein [Streptomyces sp. 130]TRV79839.1 hypothetical protein FKN01_09275 [Streptomyces sp. 130]
MNGRARSAARHGAGGRSSPPGRLPAVTGRHRTVRARFVLREAPGVTVGPAGHAVRHAGGRDSVDDAALLAVQRALAEAGRGYLGGRLELRAPGRTRAARDRRALRRAVGRAAALAVAATLRGDDTGVDVRVTRR